MSLETLNGCILFPNAPDIRNPIEFNDGFQSGVTASASGQEKRSSFRATGLRSIFYDIFPSTSQAQHRAQARLLEALETGKIAVPIWGMGQPLAATFNQGSSVATIDSNQWDWSVGDYFIFPSHGLDDEDYVTGTVAGISGNDLTLTISDPTFEFLADEMIYPVLFGQLDLGEWNPRTIFHAPVKISVREPIPSGSLGEPTANAETSYESITTDRICDQVPILSVSQQCGASAQLSWTAVFGADSYKVYSSDTSGSGYSLIATQSTRTYAAGKPYLEDKFWVVTAVIGGEESDYSNEVTVEGSYIEKTMRALQERHYAALGTYIDWPDHAISAADPGNYPIDGFYDADIAAGGAAREVVLIQAIADELSHNMLQHYTSETTFENADPDSSAGYYSDGSSTFFGPFTVLPLTVTTGNKESSFNSINELICYLERLTPAFTWASREIKQGIDLGPRTTANEAIGIASAAFDAASYSAASSPPNISASALDTPGLSPYWTADFRSVKGIRTKDVSQYGNCRMYIYIALDPTIGGSPEYAPFSVIEGNNPPISDVDGNLHLWIETTSSGGTYNTPEIGEGKSIIPAGNTTVGWEWLADRLLIIKSSDPVLEEWQYYP